MAGQTFVVTAPLATPYREDGSRAYLYQGSEWPDGLRKGETERFIDLGFIAEAKAGSEDKPAAANAAAGRSEDK